MFVYAKIIWWEMQNLVFDFLLIADLFALFEQIRKAKGYVCLHFGKHYFETYANIESICDNKK